MYCTVLELRGLLLEPENDLQCKWEIPRNQAVTADTSAILSTMNREYQYATMHARMHEQSSRRSRRARGGVARRACAMLRCLRC